MLQCHTDWAHANTLQKFVYYLYRYYHLLKSSFFWNFEQKSPTITMGFVPLSSAYTTKCSNCSGTRTLKFLRHLINFRVTTITFQDLRKNFHMCEKIFMIPSPPLPFERNKNFLRRHTRIFRSNDNHRL